MMTHEIVSTYPNNKSVAYNKKRTLPFCSHDIDSKSTGVLFSSLLQIIDEFSSHKITFEGTGVAARICIRYKTSAFRSHNFTPFKGLPLPLNFNIYD